jgi:SAM-dependent methyltransferase
VGLDWGTGRYEVIAETLEPVAEIVVERVGVVRGERALDLGCGTGNAALALAKAGADVVAVEPASRLVEVTRARTADAGFALEVLQGEAAAIPLPDDSIDVIVSVFAVIFAPDPAAALADMARVLAPGGRIVLTAWIPGYGVGRAYSAVAAYLAELGAPAAPPPFAWHDRAALIALAEPLGLTVSMDEVSLAFRAASPEAQVERDATTHPTWLDTVAKLDGLGGNDSELRARATEALREINEDPDAFRTTSRYVIATLS